jgi:hypothetical protein
MPFSLPRIFKAAALICAIMAGLPTGDDVAHAENTSGAQAIQYPWTGADDEIAVNLALGSLRDSLVKWLTTERGLDAETLLVSAGAIAGFAAQAAALERIKTRDVPGATKDMPGAELSKFFARRVLRFSSRRNRARRTTSET